MSGEEQQAVAPVIGNDDQPFRIPPGEEKTHAAEVVPGVWLGDRFAAADRKFLDSKGISAIINCAAAPPDKEADWARVAARFGFVVECFHSEGSGTAGPPLRYMIVPVKDEAAEPISDYFDTAADFVKEALAESSGVLIHCEAGRSRSATILLAMLMQRDGLSLSEALAKVKLHRAVFPNSGFVAQLHAFAERLGVKPPQADYVTAGEAAVGTEEAIEKNMKTCMWRLQQGSWYTTPSKELELLQGTGYELADCVALGILVALDQDALTQSLLGEVFQLVYSSKLVSGNALCSALRQHLLEDPAETEFPILHDILLDVPYAEQHVGAFLYNASVPGLLTPDFMEFVAASYPKVKEHMVETVETPSS